MLIHQTRARSKELRSCGSRFVFTDSCGRESALDTTPFGAASSHLRRGTTSSTLECESWPRSLEVPDGSRCSVPAADVAVHSPFNAGRDPHFSPSAAMYIPGLDPAEYFNTSAEVGTDPTVALGRHGGGPGGAGAGSGAGSGNASSAGGLPFAFFHVPVEGLPPGFPVFVPVQASGAQAQVREASARERRTHGHWRHSHPATAADADATTAAV